MGFIGGLFGMNGGRDVYDVAQGLPGFMAGANVQGVQNAQNMSQNAMAQQQAFVNALGARGGLNAGQAGILGQQQALANQFGALAQGQGPNPAQAMLAQNTGQNMQQQAAMMAGARGTQSNPGLLARQAGQVGAQAQQQAVGQAATMGAQQQLAAMQQQAAQQGQMANLTTAGVGQQQTALSQMGQQNLAYQQMMEQALQAQNQQQVQAQVGQSGIAQQGMKGGQGLFGGLLSGIGSAIGLAEGGSVPGPTQIQQESAKNLPHPMQAHTSEPTATMPTEFGDTEDPLYQGANAFGQGLTQGIGKIFGGGLNPLATTENAVTPMASSLMAGAVLASDGGKVNGKAQVKGDSRKNDTVPAMLSPGEVVIPRSHVNDPDKIAAFLNQLLGTNLKNATKGKRAS